MERGGKGGRKARKVGREGAEGGKREWGCDYRLDNQNAQSIGVNAVELVVTRLMVEDSKEDKKKKGDGGEEMGYECDQSSRSNVLTAES